MFYKYNIYFSTFHRFFAKLNLQMFYDVTILTWRNIFSTAESVKIIWFDSEKYVSTDWISDLPFHWYINGKIFFTVESVNFHWFSGEKNTSHGYIS